VLAEGRARRIPMGASAHDLTDGATVWLENADRARSGLDEIARLGNRVVKESDQPLHDLVNRTSKLG
jgi:hypothetical protein